VALGKELLCRVPDKKHSERTWCSAKSQIPVVKVARYCYYAYMTKLYVSFEDYSSSKIIKFLVGKQSLSKHKPK
jgi:hypothetical protein